MKAERTPSAGGIYGLKKSLASCVICKTRENSFAFCRTFGARAVFFCLLFSMLSACAPNIKPQATLLNPQNINTEGVLAESLIAPWPGRAWWESYGDPQLNELVRLAVAQSPSIALAEARVREAAGAAQVAGGGLFPQADLNGQVLDTYSTGEAYKPADLVGEWKWNNSLLASASYTLDLWGKEKAAYTAGLDRLAATAAEAQTARLVLETGIVRDYIALSYQYALLDVAEKTLEQRRGVLDIARKLFDAGIGTGLAVSQAETPIPAIQSRIAQIKAAIAVLKYQIAALGGQGPGAGEKIAPPKLSFDAAPALPADLPAELAAHRPDVAARLWRVEAAAQEIKVARAAFYPNINLLAAFGFISIGFDKFLSSGAENASVGPALSLPLFEGGRLSGNLSARTAQYDQAVEDYNQTILSAFSAIASQAVRLQALETQAAQSAEALRLARKAYDTAYGGYRAGLTDYLYVLSVQNALLDAEERNVSIAAERMDAYAQLMNELGGGYEARKGGAGAASFPNPLHPPAPPQGLPAVSQNKAGP